MKSLKAKFVVTISVLIVIILTVNAAVLIRDKERQLRADLKQTSISFAKLTAAPICKNYDMYYETGFYKFSETFKDYYKLNHHISEIEIVDVKGRILADTQEMRAGEKYDLRYGERRLEEPKVLGLLKEITPQVYENTIEGEKVLEVLYPYVMEGGMHSLSVRYIFSYNRLEGLITEMKINMGLMTVVFMSFGILVAVYLSSRITKPLNYLETATRRIAAGDLKQKIVVRSKDEIGRLAASFNRMAEDLRLNIDQKEKYLNQLESRVEELAEAYKTIEGLKQGLEKKVEERTNELRLSEERYRQLYDEAPVGYHEIDREGKIVRVNQTEADLLGYTIQEMIGRPVWDFLVPGQRELAKRAIQEKVAQQRPLEGFEGKYVCQDGREIDVSIEERLIVEGDGRITGIRSALQDITERKRAEEEIEKRQKYLESVLHNAPDAIVTLDGSHRIIEWNPGAERLFGYIPNEVIGKSIDDLITNPDVMDEARVLSKQVMSGEKVLPLETVRYRKDGTPVNVIVAGSPIRVGDELQGVVAVYTDITERKQAEGRLKEYASQLEIVNKELEDFTYIVSHDLKEPLRGIDSFSQFVLEDYLDKLDEEGKDYLVAIRKSAGQMKKLIDDLLALSRITRIKNPYQAVAAGEIIEEALERVEHKLKEKNVSLIVAENLPNIFCDRVKMVEVFGNLLSNAAKFMDKKEPKIEIGYESVAGGHRFCVRDNGMGIEEKYHEKIFGMFQRLGKREDYEGTGAGLHITKKIIEEHGGQIWVESEVGVGSTFYFTLPKG